MTVLARIISVKEDLNISEETQLSRRKYVEQELLPKMLSIGIDATIFEAITPQNSDVMFTPDFGYYRGDKFVIGHRWFDTRQERVPPNQFCLTIGHLQLWKECVKSDTPILVLEDDAFLPETNTKEMRSVVDSFVSSVASQNPRAILYLQATCPWRGSRGSRKRKEYDPNYLISVNDFFLIHPSWVDLSGTASYLVTPSSARFLIDYVESHPIWHIDGMIIVAKSQGIVNVYIPKQSTSMFELHPTLA